MRRFPLRFKWLWIFTLLLVWGACACDNGDYDEADTEPLCSTNIVDETFDGNYRAVLGFGEGALAALRLTMDNPQMFNVTVALGGPADLRGQLSEMEALLADFDNWPDDLSRRERLLAMRDLIGAFGNPFYDNEDSNFYPPEVEGDDFVSFEPHTYPGIVTPDNPNGTIPSVSFADATGLPVEFLLAHDLNGNGRRDAGEPIILQLHEPFTDSNDNGRYDSGEPYDDYGIDGVNGTDDYGEGNGRYDDNPHVDMWLANDPYSLAADATLDVTPGYRGSIYLDALPGVPGGYSGQTAAVVARLESRLNEATPGEAFCIANELGRYENFLSATYVPTEELRCGEKFAYLHGPGEYRDPWSAAADGQRMARLNHALSFLSQRMPNGLYDNVPKESKAVWQIRSYYSDVLGADVEYGIGFPAGYFDERSEWKVFPIVYVLHDRASMVREWAELLTYQGDLANRLLIKQAILVVVDGSRAVDGGRGYGYYVNQSADEVGGDYGDLFAELMDFIETTYRIQVDVIDRDFDDEDDDD